MIGKMTGTWKVKGGLKVNDDGKMMSNLEVNGRLKIKGGWKVNDAGKIIGTWKVNGGLKKKGGWKVKDGCEDHWHLESQWWFESERWLESQRLLWVPGNGTPPLAERKKRHCYFSTCKILLKAKC